MKEIFNKIYAKLRKLLILLMLGIRKFKSSDTIIIFSEARGGSTWLMEMLGTLIGACINWEPSHMNHGVIPKEYNLGWVPFIPRDEQNSKYVSLFDKIHSFKIHSSWTRDHLTVKQLLTCKYVLTKYVRANMLVPFLLKNFNFRFPPIFLLRHPIDTCLSQIKAFDNSESKLAKIEIPKCINNERFIKHHDFLKQLETNLEIKIAYWCINNCPTVNKLSELNVHIVFYSDLLLNPPRELRKIMRAYNLEIDEEKLSKIEFRKTSSTDFKNQFIKTPEDQLNKNFKNLDDTSKENIQKIFDYFDFKLYSAYSPLPNKQFLATAVPVM